MNEARYEKEDRELARLNAELAEQRQRTQHKQDLNDAAEAIFLNVLTGIDEIVRYRPIVSFFTHNIITVHCRTRPSAGLCQNTGTVVRILMEEE